MVDTFQRSIGFVPSLSDLHLVGSIFPSSLATGLLAWRDVCDERHSRDGPALGGHEHVFRRDAVSVEQLARRRLDAGGKWQFDENLLGGAGVVQTMRPLLLHERCPKTTTTTFARFYIALIFDLLMDDCILCLHFTYV